MNAGELAPRGYLNLFRGGRGKERRMEETSSVLLRKLPGRCPLCHCVDPMCSHGSRALVTALREYFGHKGRYLRLAGPD